MLLLGVAVSAQPRTVTDYYLAFPSDKYATDNLGKPIKGKAAVAKHRRSLIKIEDVRNGYLRLEGAWEGWAEIALFKKKDGTYLIAHSETGCGPACSGFVKFYTYSKGNWTDVTSAVFEEPTETEIEKIFKAKKLDIEESGTDVYYLLPRVGTTVKLACNMCKDDGEPDFTLSSFEWTGETFRRIEQE